eukprot:TRINITY_DN14974_c0_g1_i1.p1 TRINITY_DN14974_c0_g1~~TRINITY_DN14974_c0_g1_i1.p1  ORF type:complete len:1108 (-),score=308.38 TRINITY_DN14974_c0_g1_i1:24-3347(-)
MAPRKPVVEVVEEPSDDDSNSEAGSEDENSELDTSGSIDEDDYDPDDPVLLTKAAADAHRLTKLKQLRRERIAQLKQDQREEAREATDVAPGQLKLRFLLAQTQVFTDAIHKEILSPDVRKSKKGRDRHQHQVSEKDEDDQLVQDELEEDGDTRLIAQPPCVKGGAMRAYQLDGLNWLIRLYEKGINGILADEMGLGKTMQTVSLLGYLKQFRGVPGPHLVIAPKSTIGNWVNEIRHWCPILRPVKLHGSQEERSNIIASKLKTNKFDVCVTTYETAIREKAALKKFTWQYMIIDEAHRIKNEQSVLAQVLRLYRTEHRLLITGTPLQNNMHELWALLNFLMPEVFENASAFDEGFTAQGNSEENVELLHKVLRPFLLRRLKADVESGMPPKKETKLFIGMSKMQREWYKNILTKDLDAINTASGDRVRLLNMVMQLRKVCNHPYLFDGAEPGPPYVDGEHLMFNSGKMVLLEKLLPRLQRDGHRVLIFSQMTRMLDILEDYMRLKQYEYCRIDGNTEGDERDSMIVSFNKPDSSKFVFLLSTRAGGLGINLATADTVILYDSDWNPQMDLQAQDRAHRIGQKKPVNVYRLVTEHTIEEKIVERAEQKLYLDAMVIQQGRLVEQNKAISKDDLRAMIRFGADQVIRAQTDDLTEADIDAILSRGEAKTQELSDKLKAVIGNAPKGFSMRGFASDGGQQPNLYLFEGTDYQGAGGPLATWLEPPKRERKAAINVDEYFRDALRTAPAGKKSGLPKPPRHPQIHDYQFYPKKLQALLDREMAAFQKQFKKEDEIDPAVDSTPLTEAEVALKDKYLTQGFAEWNRKDFRAFINASAAHGRSSFEEIAQDVGKSLEDVTNYAAVFWKRYKQLGEWESLVKRIEQGETKSERQATMRDAIAIKMKRVEDNSEELVLKYGKEGRSKTFTDVEDKWLVLEMHKHGYGSWDAIRADILNEPLFTFDWFMKSRNGQDLQRRCEKLIRLIERENQEADERERSEAVRVAAAPVLRFTGAPAPPTLTSTTPVKNVVSALVAHSAPVAVAAGPADDDDVMVVDQAEPQVKVPERTKQMTMDAFMGSKSSKAKRKSVSPPHVEAKKAKSDSAKLVIEDSD